MVAFEVAVSIDEKLRELRDKSGLSERVIAERAGIPYGTVHGYMGGRREVPFVNLVKLCGVFGVTLEHFADADELTGKRRRKK